MWWCRTFHVLDSARVPWHPYCIYSRAFGSTSTRQPEYSYSLVSGFAPPHFGIPRGDDDKPLDWKSGARNRREPERPRTGDYNGQSLAETPDRQVDWTRQKQEAIEQLEARAKKEAEHKLEAEHEPKEKTSLGKLRAKTLSEPASQSENFDCTVEVTQHLH